MLHHMAMLCLILFEELSYCLYSLYVVRQGMSDMNTNIEIKSSQFISAHLQPFALPVDLLTTSHVPDTQ